MRIRTTDKRLVEIPDVPFCSLTWDSLLKLAVAAPNLALDATEPHTGRRVRVRLYQLDFDFAFANAVNVPGQN